jgi:hypothetical protein
MAHTTILSGNSTKSGSSADSEAIDPQSGLPNPDRNALTFLAANPNTAIQFKVVTNHGDLF